MPETTLLLGLICDCLGGLLMLSCFPLVMRLSIKEGLAWCFCANGGCLLFLFWRLWKKPGVRKVTLVAADLARVAAGQG